MSNQQNILLTIFHLLQSNNILPLPNLKILVVGSKGVGKSTLIGKICDKENLYESLLVKKSELPKLKHYCNGRQYVVHFWDLTATARINEVSGIHFKGLHGCIIMVEAKDSQEELIPNEGWISRIQYECLELPILLVINKVDALKNFETPELTHIQKMFGMKLFGVANTSASNNYNIEAPIMALINHIIIGDSAQYTVFGEGIHLADSRRAPSIAEQTGTCNQRCQCQ